MSKRKTRKSRKQHPVIMLTGDYVQDIFVYVGNKPTPKSEVSLGTRDLSTRGGVFLIRDILNSSKIREEEDKKTKKNKQHLLYNLRLNMKEDFSEVEAPKHLRSYAVWRPFTKKGESSKIEDMVWRCEESPPGYGMETQEKSGRKSNRKCGTGEKCNQKECYLGVKSPRARRAKVLVLDDAGLMIRHKYCSVLLPDFLQDIMAKAGKNKKPSTSPGNKRRPPVPTHIILKMSHPLAEGDLWKALEDYRNRLTVVISIKDIRRMEAGVSKRISWERSAMDLIRELNNHPRLRPLLECRNLVVNFNSDGALWVEKKGKSHTYHLFFDPGNMERESAKDIKGRVFGFQSCLTASLAHWMIVRDAYDNKRPEDHPVAMGICGGLRAMRTLLLNGHGKVRNAKEATGPEFPEPAFPAEKIADTLSKKESGYSHVEIPSDLAESNDRREMFKWSILSQQYEITPGEDHEKCDSSRPLFGLGMLTARFGEQALLNNAPLGIFGKMLTVDRMEIESLRNLARLIEEYENERKQKKPLSIAVFGAPGSGKSFGVEQIAKSFLGKDVPILVFNLSQFRNPDELIGAFHQVRDKVLEGKTPVVFWDEFDSREYQWLQYLLAPMQDGAFQDGQITHPIGKCIFVFAGATSYKLENFGPVNPESRNYKMPANLRKWRQDIRAWDEFKLKKGPDFLSRLHGFIDIVGPNPRRFFDETDRKWKIDENNPDKVFPIRRALILRSQLRLDKNEVLNIDHGLLEAMLCISEYKHGARSMERVAQSLVQAEDGQFHRANLPAPDLLERLFEEKEFNGLMQRRNPFKSHPDIEKLATAEHDNYRNKAKSNGWPIKPEVNKKYEDLSPGYKDSNRAAALRIPEILELIDFYVCEKDDPRFTGEDVKQFQKKLAERLQDHAVLELLAQAEHLLWCLERRSKGWKYSPNRDDEKKLHPDLVDWYMLSSESKNKDRENVIEFPAILDLAGCVAVEIQNGYKASCKDRGKAGGGK